MKCIKNTTTGTIIRVTNQQATQMVGNIWAYVQKSEWKRNVRDVLITESQSIQEEKKSETIAEKQLKRKKFKEKQRK
jgi:hypothetical protein